MLLDMLNLKEEKRKNFYDLLQTSLKKSVDELLQKS